MFCAFLLSLFISTKTDSSFLILFILYYYYYYYIQSLYWGIAVAQWLRCCATNRNVPGSIPAGVNGFFIDIILPIALWPWG